MSQLTNEEKLAYNEEKKPLVECPCCTDKYTSTVRKAICCPYCKKDACMACQKSYLLSSPHDAHCMFCKVNWNEDFLRDTFSSAWLDKQYSEIEWNRLWDREQHLLPETQRSIERENLVSEFHRNSSLIRSQAWRLLQVLEVLTNANNPQSCLENWLEWKTLNKSLEDIPFLSKLDQDQQSLFLENDHKKKQRAVFVRPCPAPDCRGTLSSQWVCGLCRTKVCHLCLAVKRLGAKSEDTDDKHECKAEDLQTAKLIHDETRPCPKCGVSIYKIQGCNQMFCTHCNTPFDWKSGQIINGQIHNPHYFEWLNRTNGENAGIVQPMGNCENTFQQDIITALSRSYYTPKIRFLVNFIRTVNHIRDSGAGLFLVRGINPDYNRLNFDLRYSYLKNLKTKDDFKSTAMKRYKRYKMVMNLRQVCDMLCTASASIINSISRDVIKGTAATSDKYVLEAYNSCVKLAHYFNKSIFEVMDRYKSDAKFETISSEGVLHVLDRKEYKKH